MKNKGLLTEENNACFTFDLSIRISEVQFNETNYTPDTDPTENELVRIDWSNKLSDQLFDPRSKLSVFLQFKESMKEEYKTLKFTPFVYLFPVDEKNKGTALKAFGENDFEKRIYPETIRLSTIDKSSLVLTFLHNTLAKGTCYQLVFDMKELGVRFDEKTIAKENTLCTTKCTCNVKGMQECDESKAVCKCHHPYAGDDCSKCVKGFVFDPSTNECQPATKCKHNGGEEDCNNHGVCYEDEKSGQAKCMCEKGFDDDGLDLCGKCADPLFTYPNCESRNWIIE